MKCIIIEDEKLAARKLERMLTNYHQIELIQTLHSVEESVQWLKQNDHPELIFSDIVLGDGLSFDIWEQVPVSSFIIFTTAFDQYSLNAFKLNSIDYLLKPILEEDLEMAIEKCQRFLPLSEKSDYSSIKNLLKVEKARLNRILVKIGYQLQIIHCKDIVYFYSENKIVYLQTETRAYPTDYTLEQLQDQLDSHLFFRVNRQYIIAKDYIKNIRSSPYYIVNMTLTAPNEISVSRDRVKDFKQWLVAQ